MRSLVPLTFLIVTGLLSLYGCTEEKPTATTNQKDAALRISVTFSEPEQADPDGGPLSVAIGSMTFAAASLDSIRALVLTAASDTAASAFTLVEPTDETFQLSLQVPTADFYHIFVEAIGVSGEPGHETESGTLYLGDTEIRDVQPGPNHVDPILLEEVTPRVGLVQMPTFTEIRWNQISRADRYQIRVRDPDGSTQIVETPDTLYTVPGAPGLRRSPRAGGNENGRSYRVRAVLRNGFFSAYSESVFVAIWIPDGVTDLSAGAVTWNSVGLTWTAPGDDGSIGTATEYDLRYSTSNILGDEEFNSATRLPGTPAPAPAGTGESFVVGGLDPDTKYYFALKTGDDVGNWATMSNVVTARTQSPPPMVCCFEDGRCELLSEEECIATDGDFDYGETTCTPNPCPQPVAACCFVDGSCSRSTEADCLAADGTWFAEATVCVPNPCPQPEAACCSSDGSCELLTESDCSVAGGDWMANDPVCSPNPCTQPVAACCFTDGTCRPLEEAPCLAAGGSWLPESSSCKPNPCPQPEAACCFSDGACQILTEEACDQAEGIWLTDEDSCSPNPCPQPEAACCFTDGLCQILTEAGCEQASGSWLDDEALCSPNPCPQPFAACCFADGSCQVLTETDCSAAAGTWFAEEAVCDPNPCPQIVAACCFSDETCELQTEIACADLGGTWLAETFTCSPNPCLTPPPVAVCCFADGSCLLLTETTCQGQGGSWLAELSVCDPNPCPLPDAACCFFDGSCELLTEVECGLAEGTWLSAESACEPNPCPQPESPCCFEDGSCQVMTEADCLAGTGIWHPEETVCDPNPCPPPVGACCYPDGICQLLTSTECQSTDGNYRGDGSSCEPNPCPRPDLVITEIDISPLSPICGDLVQVRVRVENQGSLPAGASDTDIILGTEVLCTFDTPALEPGLNWLTPWCDIGVPPEGENPILGCSDTGGVVNETDEENNCLQQILFGPQCPDLIILSLEFDPPAPVCEVPLRARALVKNQGAASSGTFMTQFSFNGEPICDAASPNLTPDEEDWTDWCDLGLPFGPMDVEACADWNLAVSELVETNNCYSEPINCEDIGGWSDAFGTPSGGLGTNGIVYALTVYNGRLIAGGSFSMAGSAIVSNIAQFDGISWQSLGSGTNGTVYAFTEFDGDLIAGGAFTVAGGIGTGSVARWNGVSWGGVGTGSPGQIVLDLAVYDNEIIAAGSFSEFFSLAHFNGSFWSTFAGGLGITDGTGIGYALEVSGGDLYVAGVFDQAGAGVSSWSIAHWNGMVWDNMDNGFLLDGMTGVVFALEIRDSVLYAGGAFNQTGNEEAASNVAAWTGSSWNQLGTGTSGPVYSLNTYSGDLVAGGNFATAGGASVSNIARWSGSIWNPFEEGISGEGATVYAGVSWITYLYVGGGFSSAGRTTPRASRVGAMAHPRLSRTPYRRRRLTRGRIPYNPRRNRTGTAKTHTTKRGKGAKT